MSWRLSVWVCVWIESISSNPNNYNRPIFDSGKQEAKVKLKKTRARRRERAAALIKFIQLHEWMNMVVKWRQIVWYEFRIGVWCSSTKDDKWYTPSYLLCVCLFLSFSLCFFYASVHTQMAFHRLIEKRLWVCGRARTLHSFFHRVCVVFNKQSESFAW